MGKGRNIKKSSEHSNEDQEIFFFGEYEHSVDSQRRIAIPKSWRAKNGNTKFVLLHGHDAIQIIPYEVFKRDIYEKMRKISFADREGQKALALLASQAQECECDAQGRIAIPQKLMELNGIKEQAILVGALSTAQIWAKEKWEKVSKEGANALDVIHAITEKSGYLAEILKTVSGEK